MPLTKKLKGGTDPVYDVTIDGKRYVFREMDEYQDMRLSIAAAQLNEAIGIGTAPRLRVAKVNGKLGTLSDFVEGAKLPQLNRQTPLKRLLEAGTLNEESYFDAKAFEFLVGNTDAKCVDSFINPEGKVVCVDHNYAFRHGLVEYFPYEAALGPVLPSRYSAKWVAFVNETKRGGTNPTKRDAIIANLKIYLSPAEVDATLFRLEVIAADMDRKK